MGKRGPQAQPTRLKILKGNPGKRPLPEGEPQPSATPPKCPAWLSKQAKAEWKKLAAELSRLGLVTLVDEGNLAGYCAAYAEFRDCQERLEREGRYLYVGGIWEAVLDADGKEIPDGNGGVVVANRGGQMQPHPALAQQKAAWTHLRAFSALFGLSPSHRVGLSSKPAEEGDEFDDFVKGGKKRAE